MKPTLVVLALALTIFATSIHADEFHIEGSAFFAADRSSIVETFGTSFNYDPASLSVSDMSFGAAGLLGSDFSFTGVTDNAIDTRFEWSGPEAIIFADFGDWQFPAASSGVPVDSGDNIFLGCVTSGCTNDFPVTILEAAASDVSALPVPAALSQSACARPALEWISHEVQANFCPIGDISSLAPVRRDGECYF